MGDAFFNGDVAVDAKSFDGITKQIPAGQTIAPGVNGGAVTLALMDQLIDLVKPGRPDALLMSKRTRRKLSELRRAAGNLLEVDRDQFGLRALFYDGIPIVVDDFVSDTQPKGTSGAVCSSIYAVKFGQGIGLMGLEHDDIQIETVGGAGDEGRHLSGILKSVCEFDLASVRRPGVSSIDEMNAVAAINSHKWYDASQFNFVRWRPLCSPTHQSGSLYKRSLPH